MSKGNFEQFLEALGAFESGKPSGDPEQYKAVNNFTGATGKYQFTQIRNYLVLLLGWGMGEISMLMYALKQFLILLG